MITRGTLHFFGNLQVEMRHFIKKLTTTGGLRPLKPAIFGGDLITQSHHLPPQGQHSCTSGSIGYCSAESSMAPWNPMVGFVSSSPMNFSQLNGPFIHTQE